MPPTHKRRLNEKLLESLQYEISAMKRLRHNNVVQLFDIIKVNMS